MQSGRRRRESDKMNQVTVLSRTDRMSLSKAVLFPLALALAVAPLSAQSALPPAPTPAQPATPAPQKAVPTTPAAAPSTTPVTTQSVPANAGQNLSQEEAAPTIRIQVNEVNLIFTVTDKKGRFITGLERQNF